MDQLQTRLDALEQQMHAMNRRLHWWRGLAGGAVVLAVLTWTLPAVIAQEEASQGRQRGLAQRVAALEQLLNHFSREGKEIFITGANLHIVNGLGRTDCGTEEQPIPDCPNGRGNLIVGYNEPREFEENIRTGSHNVVVGQEHNFSRFAGLVVGQFNTISGDFAVVSSGRVNTASGFAAAVSGGDGNTASGDSSAVSGGLFNEASGVASSVSGGNNNTASGFISAVSGGVFNQASGGTSSVSGGQNNMASGERAAVSGGDSNTASGFFSAVGGGVNNTASGERAAVSGGAGNIASGFESVVSGGLLNTASGDSSAVSGGQSITQATDVGWAAGSEAEEVVVGNFRSP
jgi:hypothetical protein